MAKNIVFSTNSAQTTGFLYVIKIDYQEVRNVSSNFNWKKPRFRNINRKDQDPTARKCRGRIQARGPLNLGVTP